MGATAVTSTQPKDADSRRASRKVIVGYERTPQGEDALVLAEMLAPTLGSPLTVATILRWPRNLMGPTELQRSLEADTSGLFHEIRERVAPLEIETRALANPSPAEALSLLADEERASLIVVGSSQRGSFGRVYPGSVGSALLHGAPCAIAVAPRGYASEGNRHLLRIGVAFDGSPESWVGLETGIAMAERTHARLAIYAVAEPARYGYAASYAVLTAAEMHDFELEEKQRVLQLARGRVPEGLPVETKLMRGDPSSSLADESEGVDLMVLGSRGYGPIRRTLLGSTSARLMRAAGCPILILPRAAGLDPLGFGSATKPG